ncbi:FAD:protein FMN transferase [Psychromonas sp.]|nr:FAD:protein FMN transferase [Psychromonas sp.]
MPIKLYRYQFSAMGSPCTLRFYHANEIQARGIYQSAVDEVKRLEDKYSRYLDSSLLSQINKNAGTQKTAIDAETASLLVYAEQAYQISDGLFDITTGVLRKVWDFKAAKIPSQQKIDNQLSLVDWSLVEWDQKSILLPQKGMEIDFGGIVKEYAADAVATLLKRFDIKHGVIDLGGDIHVIGPDIDGKSWQIGIRDPNYKKSKDKNPSKNLNKASAYIPMSSGGLASSGDYERNFIVNGKKYSHILNPKTGWPALGLSAVSIWSEQTIIAGTIATISMLKQDQGIAWLKELEIPFFAMDNKDKLYKS